MPRVVKHPDIRRAELLDRATGLFLRHGYDNVSLNDLIADAGVSKGAFYHWFPSKDALIEALAERSAREAFAGIEHAVAGCDGDALARLNAVLRAGFDVKMEIAGPDQLAAMVSLMRPANAHLYGRIVAIEEALWAAEAIGAVTDLPLVLSFSFDQGTRTMMGLSAADVVAATKQLPLAALGSNCGRSLADMAQLTALLADFRPALA